MGMLRANMDVSNRNELSESKGNLTISKFWWKCKFRLRVVLPKSHLAKRAAEGEPGAVGPDPWQPHADDQPDVQRGH